MLRQCQGKESNSSKVVVQNMPSNSQTINSLHLSSSSMSDLTLAQPSELSFGKKKILAHHKKFLDG